MLLRTKNNKNSTVLLWKENDVYIWGQVWVTKLNLLFLMGQQFVSQEFTLINKSIYPEKQMLVNFYRGCAHDSEELKQSKRFFKCI